MALSIFAPTTGTFAPGNDCIGFATGTDLPAELAAWQPYSGVSWYPSSALIAYNSDYNTSNTYSQVKFLFGTVTCNAGIDQSLVLGYGVVVNATVSTTAYISPFLELALVISGSGGVNNVKPAHSFQVRNALNFIMTQIWEDDSSGDARLDVCTNTGGVPNALVPSVSLISNLAQGLLSKGGVTTYDNSNGGSLVNSI